MSPAADVCVPLPERQIMRRTRERENILVVDSSLLKLEQHRHRFWVYFDNDWSKLTSTRSDIVLQLMP